MTSHSRFLSGVARVVLVVAMALMPLLGMATVQAAEPAALPAPIEASLCGGQTTHFDWTAVIPPAPIKADVLFAFDTTGSMASVIGAAKTNAISITTALAGLVTDVQFGVVDFRDYYPTPAGYGDAGDWPYLLRQPITSNLSALQAAINAMSAGGGNDSRESYGRVLYESYSDAAVGWRAGARRFVVMFGDNRPHDPDPGRDATLATGDDLVFANVLAGMRASGVTLIFVYTGSGAAASVQAGAAGEISPASVFTDWQAWAPQAAPGSGAVNLGDPASIATVIQGAVSSASSFITRLDVQANPSSYQPWVAITPTAYTNITVPITGLTVTFGVNITAPLCTPRGADYNFNLNMVGDGGVYATQPVLIHVSGTCPAGGGCGPVEVPEGSTLLFLASGLPALWAYARLRSRRK